MEDELKAERALREMAERDAEVLRDSYAKLEEEVVVAYGKVEDIGNEFGALFKEALLVSEAEKDGELDAPENQRRVASFLRKASSLGGLSKEIIAFDGNPSEGGRFYASTYQAVFDLDDPTTQQIQKMFEGQIQAARDRGLTLDQMPLIDGFEEGESVEAQKDAAREWLAERQAFYRGFRDQVRIQMSPEQQTLFDAWVETDGVGFNNVTFRGQPIGFTLGGKQG